MSDKHLGASISLRGLVKRYGSVTAVDGISLDVREGEFLSLLGSSGSGKSTTLMMLAGFERPDAGRILVDGRDIGDVPANKRNLGMVFQSYALFPHMSVFENVAYPLQLRKVRAKEIRAKVESALELVRLPFGQFGKRRPAQLSGGQQQRVALARALVFEPRILLMDEPLGALDKQLRGEMQLEIKRINTRLGLTVVYVTHDQQEALTMSDRIALLRDGRIEQVGDPEALYERPANTYVANFLGESNFFPVARDAADRSIWHLRNGRTVNVLESLFDEAADTSVLAIRPERLRLTPHPGPGWFDGQVTEAVYVGDHRRIEVRCGELGRVVACLPARGPSERLAVGSSVSVDWDPDAAVLLPEVDAVPEPAVAADGDVAPGAHEDSLFQLGSN
ncbi:ABC transporter ATP-binding protein [Actinomadura macra]|uniref:ABC transporter ATP-binding protein n=1 Tax=Actinomadura macra TaxID=46164 RepID=UPI00082EA068|nr:ABC transporter ATP-binding protein [Actinomadura macra]